MPRVSVVLPTYNQADYLRRAIDSVLAQTWADLELLVVDDGSTDATPGVLAAVTDPRMRVIRRQNGGLPRALNTGFDAARGDLLTWVSSDNVCAPHMLDHLVAALAAEPDAWLAVSPFAYIDAHDRILGVVRDQDLSLPSFACGNPGITAFLYRRRCLVEVGPYREHLLGAEDWDMWLRIAERAPVAYTPAVLYYYRDHPASMTHAMSERVFKASCRVFEEARSRHGGDFDLGALYPGMAACPDPVRAEVVARMDFARRLLASRFAPHGLAVACLERALVLAPGDLAIRCNLAAARGHGQAGRPELPRFEIEAGALRILLRPSARVSDAAVGPPVTGDRVQTR